MTDPSAAALAFLVPLGLAIGALVARFRPAQAWSLAAGFAFAAPLLAVLSFPALSFTGRAMLLLVVGIGAFTLRFSRRYLDGERDTHRYVQWFLLTLTGASLVVTTGDLVVLALSWTLASLSLHQLLTFGPPRAGAEIAAHKKFLLSRVADAAMLAAVVLLARSYGSTDLGFILDQAREGITTVASQAGVLCLVLAVVLRSAQLPFHGWLIQVMEAPTPVSALLHAGVVNLGAYVLIALAPLLLATPGALAILLIAGLSSALLGALASIAQPHVKGALAWSTCAQMGFVLVEIGVGAFDLALLHVLGHAAYKAHAFLASGSGVTAAAYKPAPVRPSGLRWMASTVIAVAIIVSLAPLGRDFAAQPTVLFGSALLAFALVPIIATAPLRQGWRALTPSAVMIVGLPALYAGWHLALGAVVPSASPLAVPAWASWTAVTGFAALLATYAVVTTSPSSAMARALYPHALAGFHLDAVFSRLTFLVWPPTLTPRAVRVAPEAAHLRLERAA